MAGKWDITSISVTFLRLFDTKAPNLIPQMVLDQSADGGSIADGVVQLNINGYSQNVHKMYRYGKNTYTGSLPLSTSYVDEINREELNKACQAEARKHMVNQIPIMQKVADELYAIGEDAYWEWFNLPDIPADEKAAAWDAFKVKEGYSNDAQAKADYTVVLSTTLTTNIILFDFTNNPNPFWEGWEGIYTLQGLWVPVESLKPEDGFFLANAEGLYPKYFVDNISNDYDPVIFEGYHLDKEGDTKDDDAIYYKGQIKGYPNPPDTIWYIQTLYKINEFSFKPNEFVFNYKFSDETYPNISTNIGYNFIINTRDGEVVLQTSLPIVKIRDEKVWVDIDPDTRTDIGKTTLKILDKIQVTLPDIIKQFDETDGVDDMESIFILFGCPIVSNLPSNVKYWIRFYEVLRENVPIKVGKINDFPWDDDNISPGSSSLEQSTTYYREHYYPDVRANGGFVSAIFYNAEGISFTGYTYKTYLQPREQWDEPIEGQIQFTFTFSCGYIYRDIINGSIGKIGTTFTKVENWGVVPVAGSNINGSLDSFVEYQEQISETQYKVVRVHNPIVEYQSEFGGLSEGEKASNIDNKISLVGTNATFVDPEDPYNFMRVPINYEIVRTFSGNTETKIYYDSLGLIIFSIVIDWIPGWKTFLQVLLFIILILVIALTGQVWLLTIAIISLVGTVLGRILALVLTPKDAAAAAIGITVVTAILSFGTSLPISLLDLAKLALQLLGVVSNIIASVQQMKLGEILEDFEDLAQTRLDTDKELDTARNLLNPQNIIIDPLMVGGLLDLYETPNEYYADRLRAQPLVEVFEMVHDYVTGAMTLPEFRYEDNAATTTTTALGVLPRTI